MDTGNYMANQMDNLITAGIHEYEEFCDKLSSDMEGYIKERGYTWTVEDICNNYRNWIAGHYVSHTCKDVILKFKDRLEKIIH